MHKTCIYSKKQKTLIVKSHQTCTYSKNQKFRLYVGLTGIDELVLDFFVFFEYMQVWWRFTKPTFFEYMQVLRTFGINVLIIVWVYAVPQHLRILKKNEHFDRESHKTCIYSKKSKALIVKSHETCIYSKNQNSQTLCGTHWQRWTGSWFLWVYAGFVSSSSNWFHWFS